MPLDKPVYQLTLALELEDPTPGPSPFSGENGEGGHGAVSPEEARLRSETARAALDGQAFGWMSEYRKLVNGGWHWRVAAYIAWAASPKNTRLPKTQEELAQQHLGLASDRAIHTWRQKNPAIDEMVAVLQAAPLFEHRAEIYAALITVATSAEYKGHNDRKLALELLGDYVPAAKLEAILRKSGKGVDVDAEDEDTLGAIERAGKALAESAAQAPLSPSTATSPQMREERANLGGADDEENDE